MSSHVPLHLVEKASRRFDRDLRAAIPLPPARWPRVVTISRQLGSGGRQIAEVLAETLGWPLWDKEILGLLVAESQQGYSRRMFESVDEKAQGAVDAFASSLVGDMNEPIYLHLLPRAILAIAEQDAIVLGRGAHLVLRGALRIRVVASTETRLDNLVRREGIAPQIARKQIAESDRERAQFLRDFAVRLGKKGPEGETGYDLVINMDRISVQEAVDLILFTLQRQPRLATVGIHAMNLTPRVVAG